jgi:branched-chain amino acid transport system permease protein
MRKTFRRNLEVAVGFAMIVAIVAVGIGGSRLAVYNFTIIPLNAIVVISLNLLLGLAGQVSFAQTTFMGIGGYGTALLTLRLGFNPWLALATSATIACVVAWIIGRPLLRLRGHYLAMASFALALGFYSFAGAATPLTNGSIGISGVPPLSIDSFTMDSPLVIYGIAWVACALTMLVYAVIENSHIGRAMRAVATNQEVAASLGIDVAGTKTIAFMIAAFMASIAGSLYVEYTSFVGPDLYDIGAVVMVFLMLFIGGRGSIVGPVIGATLLTLVPQFLSSLEQYQNLVFFIFLLVLILIWPSGLFGRR